jgi:hypothetical protein
VSDESMETPESATLAPDVLQSCILPHLVTEAIAQDAGAGKVRGQNGRFMPKAKSFQPKKTVRKGYGRKRFVQQCKQSRTNLMCYSKLCSCSIANKPKEATVDQGEAEAPSPALVEDPDKTLVDISTMPLSTNASKLDVQDGKSSLWMFGE